MSAQEILAKAVAARAQETAAKDPAKPETDPVEPKGDVETGDDGEPLRPEGVRALARIRAEKERLKADFDALKVTSDEMAARLAEVDQADMTELEKLQAKAAQLEEQNSSLTTGSSKAAQDLMRLQVAVRSMLDEGQVKRLETTARRLVGETEEELTADAADLLESFQAQQDKQKLPADRLPERPVENLRGGAAPDEEAEEMDPDKLAAEVRRRSGRS